MEVVDALAVLTLIWAGVVLCIEVCGPAIRSWFEGD